MKTMNEETVRRVKVTDIGLSESQFQRERRRRREAEEERRKQLADRSLGPELLGLEDEAASLEGLARSIGARGIIEPLIVREPKDAEERVGAYELIAGERRLLAAKMAGLREVPVIVRNYADEIAALGDQIGENLHRDDCSPVEEAVGIRELQEAHGLTQDGVGRLLGRSQQEISKRLGLLRLPEKAREAVSARKVSINAAQLLLRVPPERMDDALGEVLSPPHAPDAPLSERAAVEWLLGRYVRPAEEKAKWEARRGDLVALYGDGIEDPEKDVLTFEECAQWWSEGEEEPHYDAPWRLAEAPVGEAVLRKYGLHGGIKPAGTTWADLGQERGARCKVARDGRGSPVLVLEAAPLTRALSADYDRRIQGYADSEGIGLALARQHAVAAHGKWLAWHGVEVAGGGDEPEADIEESDTDGDDEGGESDETPRGVDLPEELAERIAGIKQALLTGPTDWEESSSREALTEVMRALVPKEFDARGCDHPDKAVALLVEIYLSTLEGSEQEETVDRFAGVFAG